MQPAEESVTHKKFNIVKFKKKKKNILYIPGPNLIKRLGAYLGA